MRVNEGLKLPADRATKQCPSVSRRPANGTVPGKAAA
jgi:hypothetical protein